MMGTTQITHLQEANWTIIPPKTNPRQRPKVPPAAKLPEFYPPICLIISYHLQCQRDSLRSGRCVRSSEHRRC